MKEIINPCLKEPRKNGITPVWNKDSKILIVGSITATDGIRKGFYYASAKNQLWQLLDISLNEQCFYPLKEQLILNYDLFHTGKKTEKDFEKCREEIKTKFKDELLQHKIAICDIFTSAYFNNGGSMDTDMILNDEKYPFVTSKEILQKIINESQINTVVVNSKFVEKWFKKLQIEGNYKIEYVISPSPRRGAIASKIDNWKKVFASLL